MLLLDGDVTPTNSIMAAISCIECSTQIWTYRALQAEVERLLFEDPDLDTGFMLHPDLKWDQVALQPDVQSSKHCRGVNLNAAATVTSRLRHWFMFQTGAEGEPVLRRYLPQVAGCRCCNHNGYLLCLCTATHLSTGLHGC